MADEIGAVLAAAADHYQDRLAVQALGGKATSLLRPEHTATQPRRFQGERVDTPKPTNPVDSPLDTFESVR